MVVDREAAAMARSWSGRDDQGRLNVYVKGRVEGETILIRRRVPRDDESLAQRTVQAHNTQFLVGDYRILEDALAARRERHARGRGAAPRRSKRRRRRRRSTLTVAAWHERWVEDLRGVVSEHTWRSYKSATSTLLPHIGDMIIEEIDTGDLVSLRSTLVRAGLAEPTIKDKLCYLQRMFRDAVLAGEIDRNPFSTPLPKRQTKQVRRQQRTRQVTKRPRTATELEAILDVCRNPKPHIRPEMQWFPLTEALVLTGLRWGEVAAWMWSVVSESSRLITVKRAIEHYGAASPENATKTGAEWTIPLRDPLLDLIRRQRERSYVGNVDGWIFPSSTGGATHYKNWYNRGWKRVLRKAKVEATEGDAQKMLRKTYITNALVCGRLPKRVAAEVGHASLRMITEQYEMFMDEKNWPGPDEVARLVSIYGWTDVSAAAVADRQRRDTGGSMDECEHVPIPSNRTAKAKG